VANYPKSAYGTYNPNSGKPANGNWNAWGGYCYPGGVPSGLMGSTNYTNKTNGQKMVVQMRKELVPLWNLAFEICDRKHNYTVWANKNGENWGPWGYANRAISGSNNPSGHSAALSVDMNAPYNGYSSTWQCDMPPAMVADLESLGLYWGGRYTGKYDPMHYGYCWTPADVAGHITKAQKLLGTTPVDPDIPSIPEGKLPLIVKRLKGVDYAWADDMSYIMRVPSESYYLNLQFCGIINVDHGKAPSCEQNIIDWLKGQVAARQGIVYEPTQ
jgi:hypothetical protein